MSRPTRLRIRWVKSAIGYSKRQKATIRALGLCRLGDEVEQEDRPSLRGMIAKVSHLVEVEESQCNPPVARIKGVSEG